MEPADCVPYRPMLFNGKSTRPGEEVSACGVGRWSPGRMFTRRARRSSLLRCPDADGVRVGGRAMRPRADPSVLDWERPLRKNATTRSRLAINIVTSTGGHHVGFTAGR